MKKLITGCIIALMTLSTNSWGQYFSIDPIYYTIFDQDSLAGFDETAARASAISENFLGSEFKIKMYRLKREFIDNKYNISPKVDYAKRFEDFLQAGRPSPSPGCVNEDFEASASGAITVSTQITGWSVNGGYNSNISSSSTSTMAPYYPGGLSGPNSCNLFGCCPMPPQNSALIDCSAPGGYVDTQVGSQYPIYSVFGSGSANAAGGALNPQLTGGMFGTKVIRINDGVTGDYSMEKLSKTFLVTAQNALFQFAFISVFSPGHGCCDAGAFQIRLSSAASASGPFTVIPCPNFSVSAPSTACTATVPITYLNAGTGTTYSPSVNFGLIYHPWKLNSLDLTFYLNQYITIDILTSDCTAGGHFGMCYFDAQCGPMTITGNGVPYDAGAATVTVPTCGAAGATICAAAGLGPYSWAGPGITPNQSTPSMTNQCLTSTISATYTLFMQPQGSCVPITRIVQSTITPAPLLAASVLQAQCGGTMAVVSVTPSGSASIPSTLIWSPAPLSLNTTTTIGQYQIPTGNTPSLVTITASDPLGCLVTATANVNPAPPYPTFTVVNLTGSSDITCTYPSINLDAQTTYTYNSGSLSYFWASNSATFASTPVSITSPGIYTINAVDFVTNCGISHTIAIGVNTVIPSSTVSPLTQLIICGVPASNVNIQTTQTVSITHNVLSPQGGTVFYTTPSVSYPPGGVGVYTTCLVNDINGCQTCKTFTVGSSSGFPTYSVVSAQNFTLGCGTKSVATINISNGSTTPPGGPVSYTLIGPASSSTIPTGTTPLSSNNTYTVNVPGTWTVITKDNTNLCETRTPISILDNKFLPNVSAVVPSQILDCNTPRTTLKAKSLTNNVFYTWNFPGSPSSQPGDTITIYVNPSTPNASLIANYTVQVTDSSSTCQNFSVVPMYQNMFLPKAIITNGGTGAISCKTPSVMLTNQSTSSIPAATGFPTGNPVVGYLWKGPSPQPDISNSSTYLALIVGTYTMYAQDKNNGCITYTTIDIADNRDYPVVNNPIQPGPTVLDCGAISTKVTPIITSPTTGLTYTWTAPGSASITNQFSMTLTTNEIGEYRITVLNPSNGCQTESSMNVINGSLTASFDPDQTTGYAPLPVTFVNTSKSTSNNSGITSIWNYGNGTTYSVGTATISGSALYNQPGSYTVTLFASKGSCMESARKVITVEVASKMEIPNIFTPNGDKVNDYFHLTASNLTEITAVIIDRWGHVVYELTSSTGNIEWDGKNQKGVDVAEGVYFYTITGKGKDGIDYNKNGTVTVAR
ncbi:MAG: gliding motility-associated C-terminal domain-containing protein [bacterium]|nr:gliding motility-associated C-terminal domain-containing protein [bacterium]